MIDWKLLSDALSFYQSRGYTYTDVPWVVKQETALMTFSGEGIKCQLGDLIGSAEQGFLELYDDLDDKPYVSCSPCFRNEPVLNELTQSYFMKVELFSKGDLLDNIINDAKEFFSAYCLIDVIDCGKEFDIVVNNVEIGSYGIRNIDGKIWTYGTGLALPRFSIVRE